MNHRGGRPGRPVKLWGLACLIASALISGCATLSEDECLTADWESIGYEDGAAGKPAARIADHRKACAEHGVTPNMAAYRHGRELGLREFCRPDRAYQLGRSGRPYSAACPAEVVDRFAAAYDAGREVYDLERSIQLTEGQLRLRQRELADLSQSIEKLDRELVDSGTSSDRRVELLLESRELVEKRSTIESEIDQLQYHATWKRSELANLKASHSHPW